MDTEQAANCYKLRKKMDYPSSRDEKDLAPELRKAWHLMQAEFLRLHPSLPQPFLTQTYRNEKDQNADYARGRTAPGKVVTNARFSQSLHNFYPALSFDVAFKDAHGAIAWDTFLFEELGKIAVRIGIGWGGLWRGGFRDYPHFEPLNYTWHEAQAGTKPTYPANLTGAQISGVSHIS